MNFSAPPRRHVPPIQFGTKLSRSSSYNQSAPFVGVSSAVKTRDDEYPVLGGASAGSGGGSHKVAVTATATTTPTTTKGSFAKLAASWAQSEEERKVAETNEMRERLERERREQNEIAARRRIYNSIYGHRQQSHQQEYTAAVEEEDEYTCDRDEYVGETYHDSRNDETYQTQHAEAEAETDEY